MEPRPKQRAGGFAKRANASLKISKRIGWLNKNGGLKKDIRYREVKDLLSQLGESGAMKLLKNLETNSDDVRDPTTYLTTGCLRELEREDHRRDGDQDDEEGDGDGGRSDDEAQGGNDSPENVDLDEDGEAKAPEKRRRGTRTRGRGRRLGRDTVIQRLEQRIQWLNEHMDFTEELSLDRLGEDIIDLGLHEAMTILKRLEERAKETEVRSPNAFVATAVKRAGSGAETSGRRGAGGIRQSPIRGVIKSHLKAGSKGSGDFLEKVRTRIAWLNANAGLSSDIIFDEVRDTLAEAADRTGNVMAVLKELEEKAPEIRDPTGWLISTANKRMRSVREEVPGVGDTAGGDAPPPPPPQKRPRAQELPSLPTHERVEKLEKRIQWLNSKAPMASPLRLDKVVPILLELDLWQAFDILKRFEEVSDTVRDPTAWVASAARQEASGKGPVRVQSVPPPGRGDDESRRMEKLERRLNWLNDRARLASPLKLDKVMPLLLDLDLSKSLDILKRFEEVADTVRDPTAYVTAAARQEIAGEGPAPIPHGRREDEGSRVERLERRIEWLNDKAGLASPLRLDRVMPILLELELPHALDILSRFEEVADTVRDPTAYVASAARQEANYRGPMSSGQAAPPPGRSEDDGRRVEKLERRLQWLNNNAPLTSPLRLDRVMPILLDLELNHAFDILKRFEEVADTVRDPTAYIASAARQEARGDRRGEPPKQAEQRDQREQRLPLWDGGAALSSSSEEARLQRRIDWLNSHAPLAERLSYEELAPELLSMGYHRALEVLNNLEENSARVKNPNAYVIMGARRASSALSPPPPHPGPPPPPKRRPEFRGPPDVQPMEAAHGAPSWEEKLERRIAWLNRNVCSHAPLDFGRLAPVLLELAQGDVFKILKDFEGGTFGEVRDPTAYILGIGRRCLEKLDGAGDERKGRRPRPSTSSEHRHGGSSGSGRQTAPPRAERLTEQRRSREAIGANARGDLPSLESRPSPVDGGLTYYASQKRGRDEDEEEDEEEGDQGDDVHERENRLRAKVQWLNDHGNLQLPLDFEANNVARCLLKIDLQAAMNVLKRLEDMAGEVRDPNAFVVATAGRLSKRDGDKGGRRGRRGGRRRDAPSGHPPGSLSDD